MPWQRAHSLHKLVPFGGIEVAQKNVAQAFVSFKRRNCVLRFTTTALCQLFNRPSCRDSEFHEALQVELLKYLFV